MRDEDFYIEESNPKRVFLTILFILFVLGMLGGVYYFYFYHNVVKTKSVTIELGSQVPDNINYYVKGKKPVGYKLDITNVSVDESGNTNSIGEYSYKIIKGSIIKKGKIFVKDTVAPEVTVKDLTVGLKEDFEPEDFVETCEDLSEICLVMYDKETDETLSENEGEYTVTLNIKDKYGNSVKKKAKLIVSANASLKQIKTSDLEVASVYPIDKNWNNTYTVKFDQGISEEDSSYESKILELANRDFSEEYDKEIKNQTLLIIYNKYNYVLGFSIRLEFEDETIYVSK